MYTVITLLFPLSGPLNGGLSPGMKEVSGLSPGLKEVSSPTAATNAFEHKYSSLHIRDFNLDSTFQLSRTYARRLVRRRRPIWIVSEIRDVK